MSEPQLEMPAWGAPANVGAVMTLRGGGVSEGPYASLNLGGRCGDDPGHVAANRRRLREHLSLPGEPRWLRQVHGARVVAAHDAAPDTEQADASWTDRPGVVCAILAADCMPVLLCDRAGRVVAAAHAGWRGLAAGVLEATVAALPVDPGQLLAWRGPAIGPGRFEVGAEVRDAFCDIDTAAAAAFRPGASGKYLADLYALARQRLLRVGVSEVSGGGQCTVSEPARFFSFRRDSVTGRMAALAWLRPSSGRQS